MDSWRVFRTQDRQSLFQWSKWREPFAILSSSQDLGVYRMSQERSHKPESLASSRGPGHSERARVELRGIARNQAHMQLWLHRAIEPHELCCRRGLWRLPERSAQLLH